MTPNHNVSGRKVYILLGLIIVVLGIYFLVSNKEQSSTEVPLADGDHLGFIHTVDADNMQITFDDVVWLSGEEGEDAAINAGLCTEETREECLPNDYFILNETVKDENFFLDKDINIFMKTWNAGDAGIMDRQINLSDFSELINDTEVHWNSLPYTINIKNGKIERIEEVYVP